MEELGPFNFTHLKPISCTLPNLKEAVLTGPAQLRPFKLNVPLKVLQLTDDASGNSTAVQKVSTLLQYPVCVKLV